uniref:Uncharacterized protein LOC113799733 n=1 Tax=Dermatophagoides pteronyssinus TaxID=6956 RepID=A0A6P6YMH1_DERPT|nr:uncharacterized protein LOC113799733 [Dermatophagoides pteronyssinus]XP_027206225.1 uncharacterized protein LOC113799733 [Dermatophagoides pteronyssinus]
MMDSSTIKTDSKITPSKMKTINNENEKPITATTTSTPKNNESSLKSILRLAGTKSLPKSSSSSTTAITDQTNFMTPTSKREFRYITPKAETGIPFIRSKPVTKCTPFKFSQRSSSSSTPRK